MLQNLKIMNWSGIQREKIDLAYPLLIARGSKGFLACSYINPNVCSKTNEACAIVSGVKTHEEMLEKEVIAMSDLAEDLGVQIGMKGKEVLELFR